MNTNNKDLLHKLENETFVRNGKIEQFTDALATNYNSLVFSNNLDELRDLQIFLTDAKFRNQELIKAIDKLKNPDANDRKKELNELLQLNLNCAKDFEYIQMAQQTIRVPNSKTLKSSFDFDNKMRSKKTNLYTF